VLLGSGETVEGARRGVGELFVEWRAFVFALLRLTGAAEVLALSGAERVERDVTRDADDPRAQRLAGAEARLALDGTPHGLAGAVFDVGVVAILVQDGRDDGPHERRERAEVPVDRRGRRVLGFVLRLK
jgi:hypothetical protein